MPRLTPSSPPTPGEDDGFDQELLGDVPPLRAWGATDPDLRVRSVGCGQHDIHDADAADQERDRGDGAQDDAELSSGAAGLVEQVERDDDVDVLLGVVRLDGGFDDRVGGAHFERAAPTWRVICESWVSSNSMEPARLFMIRSPNRSMQVLSGMYTSLLNSCAARLPPIPAVLGRSRVTPTTL